MSDDSSSSPRGSVLGGALLAFGALVVALVTLAPLDFAIPRRWELTWWSPPRDLLLNVALFVPLGFFFAAALPAPRVERKRDLAAVWSFLAASLVSVALETGQLFLEARFASPVDVATNGVGAWFGAALYLTLARPLVRRLPACPTLDHPLIGVLLLSTLAAWLDGLAAVDDRWRPLHLIPLAVVGASCLFELWRAHLAERVSRRRVTASAALWAIVAAGPALPFSPAVFGACVVAASGFVGLLSRRSRRAAALDADRARAGLRRAGLLLALYVLGLAAWPLEPPTAPSIAFPVAELTDDASLSKVLGFLERVVAFALVGLVVAELSNAVESGRRPMSPAPAARGPGRAVAVGAVLLVIAVAFQAIRGLHAELHASISEGVAQLVAGLIGASIARRRALVVARWRGGAGGGASALVADLLGR